MAVKMAENRQISQIISQPVTLRLAYLIAPRTQMT